MNIFLATSRYGCQKLKHLSMLVCFCVLLLSAGAQKHTDKEFLLHTIKQVYAGYPDKSGAGFTALEKSVGKKPVTDTFAQLSRITYFFNDLHLLLYDYQVAKTVDTAKCHQQYEAVVKYLNDNPSSQDEREGYWESEMGNCILAFKKVSSKPLTYHGYLVETLTKAPRGLCVLKLQRQPDGYFMTDYVEERMAYRVFLRSTFKNNQVLWVNSYGRWRKIKQYQLGRLSSANRFNFAPAIKVLDSSTVLVSLPDFGWRYIKQTDSLIKAYWDRLAHATTLIVDIRNNMGGSVDSYMPLFPLIYTNPILHCASYQRSSHVLIEHYQALVNIYTKKNNQEGAERCRRLVDLFKFHKDGFVYTAADTLAQAFVPMTTPKHVALLVNNGCMSAAELMVLNFKQSSKVKVFGEPTGGAVDYLDAINIVLPSKRYTLLIATSKRAIKAGEGKYDGVGIVPDVTIADTITDWVSYIKRYYEGK